MYTKRHLLHSLLFQYYTVNMPRKKKPKVSMSEEAKKKLKESGRGSYYNQDDWLKEMDEEETDVMEVDELPSTNSASFQ